MRSPTGTGSARSRPTSGSRVGCRSRCRCRCRCCCRFCCRQGSVVADAGRRRARRGRAARGGGRMESRPMGRVRVVLEVAAQGHARDGLLLRGPRRELRVRPSPCPRFQHALSPVRARARVLLAAASISADISANICSRSRFDAARARIDGARTRLDSELTALVGESYHRAYRAVVQVSSRRPSWRMTRRTSRRCLITGAAAV